MYEYIYIKLKKIYKQIKIRLFGKLCECGKIK